MCTGNESVPFCWPVWWMLKSWLPAVWKTWVWIQIWTEFGTFSAAWIYGTQDGLVDATTTNAMGVWADLCAAEYNFLEKTKICTQFNQASSGSLGKQVKFDNEVVPPLFHAKGDPVSKDEEFTIKQKNQP
jgi:hypothetical protein